VADRESLYLRLPIQVQNVLCSIEGWRIQRGRLGRTFLDALSEAENRTFWTRDQIQEYRNGRLRKFIRHCATTVPFYRNLMREYGLSPERIQTIDDLRLLPITTKKQIQEHSVDFVSEDVSRISASSHIPAGRPVEDCASLSQTRRSMSNGLHGGVTGGGMA
jgi:hypothetical protein